jgi:hypothetical protein
MNIVEGLGTTVLSIGGALVTALSPNKYISLGHSFFNAVKSGITKDGREQGQGSTYASDPTIGVNFDDPAIVHLDILPLNLASLLTLTQGENGAGPDWNKLHKRNVADRTSIPCVRTQFQIVSEELDATRPPGSLSFDTKKIVEEALNVRELRKLFHPY